MKIEKADWDSDFFKLKVGRYSFSDLSDWDWAVITEWDLVYIYVDPTNRIANDFLNRANVFLADEKVTFLMSLSKQRSDLTDTPRVRAYFSSEDDIRLMELGVQSGVYSRFKLDGCFTSGKFEELYKKWIFRSVQREIAEEVFVSEKDGQIAGVITLSEKNSRMDIGILSVDDKFRGKGIGKELIVAGIKYAIDRNFRELQVVTQLANHKACRFYEACGFVLEQTTNIYHFWRKLK